MLLAGLLVLSVLAFGIYYTLDRRVGFTGPTPIERGTSDLEQAVRDNPDILAPRLALGDAYYMSARYSEAAEQYRAALTIDDKSLLGYTGLGRSLYFSGDLAGAVPNFQTVVDASKGADIRGDLLEASYYFLGRIALDTDKFDEAINYFQRALSIERSDADAIYLLGVANFEKGNHDEAIRQLTKAVRYVPDFPEPYEKLAEVYTAKGMTVEARYATAMVAFSRGDAGKAVKELQAVTAADPRFSDGFAGLGMALEKQGKKTEAIAAYQKAYDLDANNSTARFGLARLGAIKPGVVDSTHGGGQ